MLVCVHQEYLDTVEGVPNVSETVLLTIIVRDKTRPPAVPSAAHTRNTAKTLLRF